MDGASGWRQFTAITLPNLLPTLAVTLVLSLLNTFKVFREAYLVAGAYPEKKHLFIAAFVQQLVPGTGSAKAERRSNPDGRGAGGGDRGMHKTALKKFCFSHSSCSYGSRYGSF